MRDFRRLAFAAVLLSAFTVTTASAQADPPRTEFWLAGRNESFNDGRSDYSDLEAVFKFGIFDDRTQLILKAARAWRFGGHDDRFGIEAYPHLWKGAYGYVDLLLSPAGGFSPNSSLHLEIYQSLLTRLEVSLGARRMSFESGGVTMLVGSLGAYWGRFLPSLRIFMAFGDGETSFTWIAALRRYFGRASFAWAGLGHGSRSVEAVSIGDLLGERSWLAEVGADVAFLRHLRLQGILTLRRESTGLSSAAFSLIAGYRW
jgi:YaiO family outer membrane protein